MQLVRETERLRKTKRDIYTVGERQLKICDSGKRNLPALLTFTHIPFLPLLSVTTTSYLWVHIPPALHFSFFHLDPPPPSLLID